MKSVSVLLYCDLILILCLSRLLCKLSSLLLLLTLSSVMVVCVLSDCRSAFSSPTTILSPRIIRFLSPCDCLSFSSCTSTFLFWRCFGVKSWWIKTLSNPLSFLPFKFFAWRSTSSFLTLRCRSHLSRSWFSINNFLTPSKSREAVDGHFVTFNPHLRIAPLGRQTDRQSDRCLGDQRWREYWQLGERRLGDKGYFIEDDWPQRVSKWILHALLVNIVATSYTQASQAHKVTCIDWCILYLCIILFYFCMYYNEY